MKLISNKLGFTLIEFMVAVSLSSIAALGMMSLNTTMNKSSTAAANSAQADAFRKQISILLSNLTAWRHTIKGNAALACVKNGTDCSAYKTNGPASGTFSSASPAGVFDVYDTSGVNYYPISTDGARGFNISGQQCGTNWANGVSTAGATGFSTVTPNMQCPFRLVLWWVPICPTTVGSCVNPLVHVFGYTLYNPPTSHTAQKVPFNPNNYGVNLVLTPNP